MLIITILDVTVRILRYTEIYCMANNVIVTWLCSMKPVNAVERRH